MKRILFLLYISFNLLSQAQSSSYLEEFNLSRKPHLDLINQMEPAFQIKPTQAAALQLANAFLKLRKYEKAVMYFEMAINYGPISADETKNYFSALYEFGDRDLSKKVAKDYLVKFGLRELVEKLDSAERFLAKDQVYYEYSLKSNSPQNEFGFLPVFEKYKIVNQEVGSSYNDYESKKCKFNPFIIQYLGLDSPIERFYPILDVENSKSSAVITHYDENEKRVYITKTSMEPGSLSNLKIYSAVMDGRFGLGKWEEFMYNSNQYSVAHPSITSDGEMLYFVSDMPGGFGGTDIYRCLKLEDGTWGLPINLGNTINTSGDEMYPYIAPQGNTLYFSSTGHSIFGGLDLNKAEKTRYHKFLKPENLGPPFNTAQDDFGLRFNDNYGTEGFFNSNRTEGSGGADVYLFSYQNNMVCRDPIKNFKMTVIDKKTRKPIPYVNLKMTVKADGRVYENMTDENGEVNLTVEGCNDFDVEATRDFYLNNLFYYDGFRKSVTIELDKKELNNIMELENVYYELGKFEVPSRSITQLEKLAILIKKNPDIKIELSSHTDSRGDDEFNFNLSQKRADHMVDFLVKQGVNSSQLISKGYGESKLLNNCGNDVVCDDEQHEQNRRTEIKIVEITK